MSIKRATSIYTVNYTILSRRKRDTLSHRDYKPNIQKLTNLKENIIIYKILELDTQGFPSRLYNIKNIINRLRYNCNALFVEKN